MAEKATMNNDITDCTIRLGHRPPMRAKFIRWMKGYRALVILNNVRWTINGLAVEFDDKKGNQ
jgi:hypothetical protein